MGRGGLHVVDGNPLGGRRHPRPHSRRPTTPMITPFSVTPLTADIDDLRDRLRRTRWPEEATTGGWEHPLWERTTPGRPLRRIRAAGTVRRRDPERRPPLALDARHDGFDHLRGVGQILGVGG